MLKSLTNQKELLILFFVMCLFKYPYRKLVFFSLIVFLITSYFSIGYFHPDEHFQILEFVNYKLGNIPTQYLPWEFHEQIRPTLQPILALLIIKILNAISLYNPFVCVLFLRFVTALIAWYILYKISFLLINNFSSEISRKIFLFLSFFLGFVPFISVRFSSENYSTITFLSAIYILIKYRYVIVEKIQYKLFFVGLLLGFSFFFRFQIVFAIIGLLLWLVFINKTKWENIVIVSLSGIIAIVICVLLDSWFYGKFVFTPYNYFYSNIVESKAAGFGVERWWFYFLRFSQDVSPVFGAFLVLSFLIGLVKRPKDLLVWCIIPFLGAHFIIAHKEMRFLFPIVFLFTYIISFGIEYLIGLFKIQRYGQLIFILIIISNIPFLLNNMFNPADNALYCCKYLYEKSSIKNTILISREKGTIYKYGLKMYFYESQNIKTIEYKNDEDFNKCIDTCKLDTIYVLEKKLMPERKYIGYSNKCVFKLYPGWILKFNFNNWQSRANILNIQELIKEKT
jgi:phosphatidylinositol glycan class B